MASFNSYADLAEQSLYNVDDEAELQRGQGWALLALAAAVKELAEAQQEQSTGGPSRFRR